MILSTDAQHAFVRDTADRRSEVEVEAKDAIEDWDFEKMVFVEKVMTCGVRGKPKDIQRL